MSTPLRPERSWMLSLVFLAVVGWPRVLGADAIGPPASSCPPGSTGDACHGGPYCRPSTCSGDSGCSGGLVCRPIGLCLGSISCRGGWTPPDASYPLTDLAASSCQPGSTCTGGGACAVAMRCVPPGTTSGGTLREGGCACRAGAGAARTGAGRVASLLVVAGGMAWRRRKRG